LSPGGESTVTYIAWWGKEKHMNDKKDIQGKTIQERMAEEELVKEKIDKTGWPNAKS
jgi:hypothetical protein